MSFNIFGPATKDSIRVGYISTERGFVDGISICEANEYALANPGTQFIFKTRDFIKYLNINEVNKLTPDDIVSSGSTCSGINLDTRCGPAKSYFYGGGGIGVQGNPVIGQDGSVLAVDLIHGGYGYQYPPIVEVKDNCGIGAGAVTRAVLGEVIETVETYATEEDFEQYELCDPTDVGYGLRYSPEGEVIGKWDPTLYANITSENPIDRQIKEYQEFLEGLQKPWWTSRKTIPLKITSQNRESRTKFNVEYVSGFFSWNEFMNTHAISPVPPSNAKGTDFAGVPFTIEWEEEFPYDGEYIFRGLCDEKGELYLDNIKLDTLRFATDAPNIIKKTIKAGVHRIRVDIFNSPVKETVFTPTSATAVTSTQQTADVNFTFKGSKTAYFGHTYKVSELGININKPSKTLVDQTIAKKVQVGKAYAIELNVTSPETYLKPNITIDIQGNTLVMEDLKKTGPKDPGDFSLTTNTGRFFDVKITGPKVTLKFIVDGNPNPITPTPVAAKKPSTSIKSIKSSEFIKGNIFNTADFIDKADRKLWRANPILGKDSEFLQQYGITPFDPNTSEANTDSFAGTHVIRWERVEFPVDGNYVIEIMADDNATIYIGNRDGDGRANIGNGFIDINEGGDETIIRRRGFSALGQSIGKSSETKFFKAGKYRINAQLEQLPGKPLAKGNPMALAINIIPTASTQQIISAKSWMENPLGVALTIDAPDPPVPQEPAPVQEGRCPPNPIWSTRLPGAREKWYPVTYTDKMRESNRMNGAPDWTKFMRRYAISPVKPLDTPGSDGGGVVHTNSWEVDIPYDGFYSFAVQRGDTARLYVDGNLAFDVKTAGDAIWKDFRNKPKFQKVFITKGRHTIGIELENNVGTVNTFKEVEQVIFRTTDWIAPKPTKTSTPPPAPKPVDVSFTFLTRSNPLTEHVTKIPEIGLTVTKGPTNLTSKNKQIFGKKLEVGKVYTIEITRILNQNQRLLEQKTPDTILRVKGNTLIFEDPTTIPRSPDARDDITITVDKGRFFDIEVGKFNASCKFIVDGDPSSTSSSTQQPVSKVTKNGATYEGPTPIANYLKDFISPQFADVNIIPNEEVQGKTWIFKWSNVDFPEDGQYILETEADDVLNVKIDNIKVGTAKYLGGRKKSFFNITKGKRSIELELSNIRIPDTGFPNNGVVAYVKISKKVKQAITVGASWIQNPVVIGATLIPPPCPKRIKGKGVVTEVIVDDPGNGYPIPNPNTDPNIVTTYPVGLRLKSVIVEDPGINYRCGEDAITITPDNGAVLDYTCDTYGRIIEVKVLKPGFGFPGYPEIRIPSETGINARFRPQFEVVRDPIVTDPATLIQVTDLVGLKQTGYVDGRPYYGAVFYKDGVRYAGYYETVGDLVQVYDTLRESIDAQITTPPSAIQRQGTDIRSNDPRLNLPGTPENLI